MSGGDPKHVTLPSGVLPSDVINVATVFGPFFLAQCANWALYGALCLQVYIYWLRFPKDLSYIKFLVYTVFILDTFFMVAITHAGWAVLVRNWGDINILHLLPWTWAMVPVSGGVVSCIVQLFFVWRIWKLSKSWYMPVIISLFTLTQCAFAIKTGFIAADVRTFKYIRDLEPGVWLVCSIIADILTSATLVRILWKSQTGFKDTDGVVFRLIRLTIEAAAVPVVAATIKLALIYSYHDNRHLVFCVVLGRLYSNCLLAMLNCRDPLFGGGSKPNTLAGAARLADEPQTVFSLLKSKFTFGSNSGGSVELNSRDQFASLDRAYGGASHDKILVHKAVRSHEDIDLEAGGRRVGHGIQFPRRGSADRESAHSLTSFDRSSSHYLEETPESPRSADFKASSSFLVPQPPIPPTTAAMNILSTSPRGMYETKSELATTAIGSNGRSIVIKTPPPAAAAAAARSERPRSQESFGAQNGVDFYPGR